jgi:hypothetical protein
MSDEAAEVTETVTESDQEHGTAELPADHPLVKTLEANKATIRELKAKAKRLDEFEQASKSETQKLTEFAASETARADTAEQALLRYEVATEKGVPANAMKFLAGTTREEIESSAKDVLALIGDAGKPRPPRPDPNQGRPTIEASTPAGDFAAFLRQQLNNT